MVTINPTEKYQKRKKFLKNEFLSFFPVTTGSDGR